MLKSTIASINRSIDKHMHQGRIATPFKVYKNRLNLDCTHDIVMHTCTVTFVNICKLLQTLD